MYKVNVRVITRRQQYQQMSRHVAYRCNSATPAPIDDYLPLFFVTLASPLLIYARFRHLLRLLISMFFFFFKAAVDAFRRFFSEALRHTPRLPASTICRLILMRHFSLFSRCLMLTDFFFR